MIRYALINIDPSYADSVYLNFVNDYDDVVTAEKARSSYLNVWPQFDPQNIQVIQYKTKDVVLDDTILT